MTSLEGERWKHFGWKEKLSGNAFRKPQVTSWGAQNLEWSFSVIPSWRDGAGPSPPGTAQRWMQAKKASLTWREACSCQQCSHVLQPWGGIRADQHYRHLMCLCNCIHYFFHKCVTALVFLHILNYSYPVSRIRPWGPQSPQLVLTSGQSKTQISPFPILNFPLCSFIPSHFVVGGLMQTCYLSSKHLQ